MKSFISIEDVSDLSVWVEMAKLFKKKPFSQQEVGKNKTLGLLFFNPSLRTRLSTQKAAQQLGMNTMVMNLSSDGWALEFESGVVMNSNTQEHIKEAAGVISQYCDIIGVRTFPPLIDQQADYEEQTINKFCQYATVPVVSLESATLHPLQSFADILTISEFKKIDKPKVVLTWAPHPKKLPQAVANSFAQWMNKSNVELVVTNPPGFDLKQEFVGDSPVIHNQKEAFVDADFVYAKNWSAYEDYGKTAPELTHWMVTEEKMKLTNNAYFMHCLPVRRNVVVTDQVLDGPNSLVLEQANNRTFTTQTVLFNLLNNE